jgi:hypothetical protein
LSALRVVWVSFAPLERAGQGFTSAVASVRYRVTSTAAALSRAGVDCKVSYLSAGANRRTLLERFRNANAVVLGKLFAQTEETLQRELARLLELIAALRAEKIAVLADYSDDHFAHAVLGPGYRAIANAVDRVTATTPGLADVIRQHTPVPVSVITDLVVGTRGAARVAEQAPFALLWFGHPVNLDTLDYGLPQLERMKAQLPYTLTLLTAPAPEAQRRAAERGARLRAWSESALFEELGVCDAVIIPSNPYDPHKLVKSPNRFAETVWAGRLALAHPLPAYEALADTGWVGEDLGEGLKWYAADPARALQRVREGQSLIAKRHSPEAVAALWRHVIEETCAAS